MGQVPTITSGSIASGRAVGSRCGGSCRPHARSAGTGHSGIQPLHPTRRRAGRGIGGSVDFSRSSAKLQAHFVDKDLELVDRRVRVGGKPAGRHPTHEQFRGFAPVSADNLEVARADRGTALQAPDAPFCGLDGRTGAHTGPCHRAATVAPHPLRPASSLPVVGDGIGFAPSSSENEESWCVRPVLPGRKGSPTLPISG